MTSHDISATATVMAPPARVYGIIADYRDGHRRMVPPKHFKWLRVESGGHGAGTVISFEMRLMGRSRTARAHVTEPEAGRVLAESYPETGDVTTFIVEPQGAASRVTIATDLKAKSGLAGAIERFVARKILEPIYRQELQRLAEHAEGRRVHEPVPDHPGA
jgi:hypothetical protein